jgi:hypothetical protein
MESVNMQVHIEGEGVAAACCARLFSDSGHKFSSSRVVRPKLGAVLLSTQTVSLLAEIFPKANLAGVCHPTRKRIVAWGTGAEPVTVPHAACVIAEADLLDCLWEQVAAPDSSREDVAGWRFLSGVSSCIQQQAFGTRVASVARAVLRPNADQSACWIESVGSGWLFLLPRGEGAAASLICVGAQPDALLGQSRLIGNLVDCLEGPVTEFPAFPRIASPLCGEGWLACGAAAIGFDPLCGEGTGNAARQAYLATALVRAVCDGEPAVALLAHYTSRQMRGFLRHLQLCLGYYQSGGATEFWRQEAELLWQGIAWVERVLREEERPPTHRLVGRQLVAIGG